MLGDNKEHKNTTGSDLIVFVEKKNTTGSDLIVFVEKEISFMKKPLDKVQIFGWVFLMLGIVMGSFIHYLDLDKKVVPHSFADYFSSFCLVAFLGLGVGLLIYRFIIRGAIHSFKTRALRSNGIKTTAVIKEIELGGKMDGLGNEYYPAITLHVLVNSPTGGKHHARIDTIIAITQLPGFQPGSEIDVAYDPAEPTIAMLLTNNS